MNKTQFDLDRFIKAQERDFSRALNEIKNGKKVTHWMWYIFPQLRGLGSSEYAKYYGIKSTDEAKAYWENAYLQNNLLVITSALLNLDNKDVTEILGNPDDLKLRSCMTLFYYVTKEPLFKYAIDTLFNGDFDQITIELINKEK